MVRIVLILAIGLAVTQTRVALAADYGLPLQPSPANPFPGGYVALGGSYGISSARSYSVTFPFGPLGAAMPD
jgi:hypothetical protein